ncbi:MAG: AAA family ATPase [Bacteroidota bacterium]
MEPTSTLRTRPRQGWLWAMSPARYAAFRKAQTFAVRRVGRQALGHVRTGDVLFVYLTGSKVIAGMYEAVGTAFEDTAPLVAGGAYAHRLRVRPLLALTREAWLPYDAFADDLEVAREEGGLRRVLQRVLHPLPPVDEKVLDFLVRARQPDAVQQLFQSFRAYLDARDEAHAQPLAETTVQEPPAAYRAAGPERLPAAEQALAALEAQGYQYAPWLVAAYLTAVRTRGFVILAGLTGTGKSKLPMLLAEATGGQAHLLPVHPDWTDGAEVIGYTDLQGRFRPGALLRVARTAQEQPDRFHVALLDEMNLARVEHYLADVLSRIEQRTPAPGGGYQTAPLLPPDQPGAGAWASVGLPANLALVGTVNVDESSHAFSAKVLDRAFTLTMDVVDLAAWQRPSTEAPTPSAWPPTYWYPSADRLPMLPTLTAAQADRVEAAVDALRTLNRALRGTAVQAGYRMRDEVALFVLHAEELRPLFRTHQGTRLDPLDVALAAKLVPRLQIGGTVSLQAVRRLLLIALHASTDVLPEATEVQTRAEEVLDGWSAAGRPGLLAEAHWPHLAARLCILLEEAERNGWS